MVFDSSSKLDGLATGSNEDDSAGVIIPVTTTGWAGSPLPVQCISDEDPPQLPKCGTWPGQCSYGRNKPAEDDCDTDEIDADADRENRQASTARPCLNDETTQADKQPASADPKSHDGSPPRRAVTQTWGTLLAKSTAEGIADPHRRDPQYVALVGTKPISAMFTPIERLRASTVQMLLTLTAGYRAPSRRYRAPTNEHGTPLRGCRPLRTGCDERLSRPFHG